MKELNKHDLQSAVGCIKGIFARHEWSQTELARYSNVPQPTISKIFDGKAEPTLEVLRKLCHALGVKVDDLLESNEPIRDLCGYLGTPLTGLTAQMDTELQRVVELIKAVAATFTDPKIDLYWPGEYTHPLRNAEFKAEKVYLTDRSRASTQDFVLLFCAAPSYGLGQENEIANQAGLPAIRLVPAKFSRMMAGAFLRSIDIPFTGTLDTKIGFDPDNLKTAFAAIQPLYFKHRALYHHLNGSGFGERLTKLLNERAGGHSLVAEELGISLSYLHALIEEQLTVSNPSAQLLRRMAHLLGTTVGYLLGEAEETDPTWIESRASWKRWIDKDPTIEACIAVALQEEWHHEYRLSQNEQTTTSFRKSRGPLTEADWQERYGKKIKKAGINATGHLFK